MINRYKSKEGGTMIPAQFQKGGSNLFLTMPDGGTVGPMGASPMGLPEYQTGANLGGVNQKTMQDFDHYYSQGFPMMQEGGDADMDGEDQSFYSDRMNTFIQKIRDAAEKNLETAVMEQDQQQPMAAYGMSTGNDPMNSYNPGNLDAYAKNSNYLNRLSQNAVSGYVQRMGALGPNDYYYKEKNIYRDRPGVKNPAPPSQPPISPYPQEPFRPNDPNYANNFGDDLLFTKRDGGSLPIAQDGLSGLISAAKDPELYRRAQEMGHDSIEDYKKSNWGYGKNHPEYRPQSTYPSRVRINDPRTINATSGKPINPNADLKSGDYHTGVIGEIARAARAYNQDPQELMAIALQESNLGKTDPSYGHAIDYSDPEGRGDAYDLAFAKSEKDKLAASKGYGNDELRKLQAYNGLGSVYPSTEAEYHGFNMGSIYGVPLTNAGINMADNPLYGKRIVDLRDNVLRNPVNTEYNQFLDKYNRDLANEEAVSQKQIATYNLFNRINPKYGNEFADMLQNAYSDSISNSSNNEYIYPKKDLLGGYPIPNLDNTRQRNALDRFNKGIGQSFLYEKGGALTMYQQDINSGQPGTTEGDYWTAEETAYLKTLPKAQRDAIISKGDKGKEAYQTYRKANDKPTPSAPPVNKSSTPTQPSATANNTGTGVTTGTPSVTTTPPASTTTTTTPPAATGFEGWSKTIINGVEYAVNDKNQVVGYPYQMPTGPQSYNNSNPYGGYNPYGAYGSMRGRNLGVVSKNRLTPEFREKMLAGSYGNPQLLGISEIKTRRAMDPGNRIKSMTFSYNGNADNTANPSSSSNTTTANSTNQKPGNTANTTPSNPAAYDMNRAFAQVSNNEQNYFGTEADKSKVDPATGIPDWRLQNLDNSGGAQYNTTQKVSDAWDRIKGLPVNNTDAGKNLSTKEQVLKEYDKVPAPLKEIATDHLFNAGSDPRIFTLAAAGAIDMKDSAKYKDDPKLLEDKWANSIDLINQQYNDDPQAFTSSVSDYRKVLYSKARRDSSIDTESTSGMPGLQYNAWAGRTGNTQDYIDKTYFDPAMGYVPQPTPNFSYAKGGELHRFISKYQQAIDSGQPGTVPITDWSLPSTDQMMNNYFNQGSDNKISFDGVGGKSIDYNLTNNKVGEMDLGFKNLSGDAITTNLDGTPKVGKTGMGDGFDVESKSKKKRIGNPQKDLAAINFATKIAGARDAANAETDYRIRTGASFNFNPIRSTEGNYGILSGDFMAGKRNADGNDAFHSGFNTYAQMGGSMMQNLKEGDEVYLTEEQIDQIIKRGGKLSYL